MSSHNELIAAKERITALERRIQELQNANNALLYQIEDLVHSQWRSIDTAPKDGTLILGISARDPQRPYPMRIAETIKGQRWHNVAANYWAEPTHWMPLPEPPSEQETT